MEGSGRGAGGKDVGTSTSSFSGRHHPYRRDSEKPSGLENEKVENKLYVGNLDHRVTEYHLIKMFSPFGKIRHEEYLWHTHGPRRGEPRGYGFVEYSTKEEAQRAKEKMNGRLAFGRPLVVRFVEEKVTAHNADAPVRFMEAAPGASSSSTTSTTSSSAGVSRNARIAAIQNKLRSMETEDASKKKVVRGKDSVGTVSGRGALQGSSLGAGNQAGRLRPNTPPGQAASAASQPRTLLQSGHRWSAWG